MTTVVSSRRTPSAFWLIPIILLATGIRLFGLGNDNLWSDEAFSVVTSLGPPGDLLRLLAAAEPHPPLYPFLLAGWLRLFGSSEFIARLPSAFAGIAAVPVAAALARPFGPESRGRWSQVAPLVAALLVAITPFQVWYSQEARMYAQVSFFAGFATLALLRLRRGRRGALAGYVVGVLGAAGSHYYGLFIPLAHGLAVLAFARARPDLLRRWIRAIAVAVALYLPWTYLALRVFSSYYGGPPGSEDLPHLALSAWARVLAGWSLPWDQAIQFAAILSVVAVLGMLIPARNDDDRFVRVVLILWLVVPVAAGYAVSLVRPLFNERYLIVCSLPFILLLTRGITGILVPRWSEDPLSSTSIVQSNPPQPVKPPRQPRGSWYRRELAARVVSGTLVLLVVAGVALVALRNVWQGLYVKSTYGSHVQTIDLLAQARARGDAIILDGSIQEPLYRYYARAPLPWYTLPSHVPLDPDATVAQLDQVARSHLGAWVVWYGSDLQDPTNVIGRWLSANAFLAFDTYSGNTRLQYYRFASDLAPNPATIALGSRVKLDGYSVDGTSLASGGSVAVELRLQAGSDAPSHLRTSLRLVDALGGTWAQTDQDVHLPEDSPAADQPFVDRHGLMVPPGTPPGEYALLLNAYSPAGTLAPKGDGAPIVPGGIRLGTIQVKSPSRKVWTGDLSGFHPLKAPFADGLDLLGYAATDTVTAGQSGALTLLWTARAVPPSIPRLRVELEGANGQVAETRDLPFASAAFPSEQWQTGDVVREQYRLPVGSNVPAGRYRIGVLPLPEGASATGSAGAPAILGSIQVQPNPLPASAAPPSHPLAYVLGSAIALDGYDLAPETLRPGADLSLTLHWRDVAPVDADYTVFVHLLDAKEKVVAQKDQPPEAGQRPTSSWFPDDVILDQYHLLVPATLPPGDYAIEVGMYHPTDGKRLPVSQSGEAAGDRVILVKLPVGEAN